MISGKKKKGVNYNDVFTKKKKKKKNYNDVKIFNLNNSNKIICYTWSGWTPHTST